MMETLFKQCELHRCVDGRVETVISWVPEDLAVPGAHVSMRDPSDGEWTEGWIVITVSEPAWPAAYLVRHRDAREVQYCDV